MSAPSGSRSQEWLDLQAEHNPIAKERTPAPATPSKWVRFKGKDSRWHAVYAEALGGYWLYCSRFGRPEAVKEARPTSALDQGAKRCNCCKSRIRCPYLVPDELAAVRGEVR